MDVTLILFCIVSLAISLYMYNKFLLNPLPYSSEEVESYYDLAARRYGMAAEEE